jgi:hypothetical protein
LRVHEWRRHANALIVVVGLVVLASGRLAARDFWLSAKPWEPDSPVTISANLGDTVPVGTDDIALEGVERWRIVGPGGDVIPQQALRRNGRGLIADVQLPAPGACLATMTVAQGIGHFPLVFHLPGRA